MIEYNLTNESTDITCTFINFDNVIAKIINDSNINGIQSFCFHDKQEEDMIVK